MVAQAVRPGTQELPTENSARALIGIAGIAIPLLLLRGCALDLARSKSSAVAYCRFHRLLGCVLSPGFVAAQLAYFGQLGVGEEALLNLRRSNPLASPLLGAGQVVMPAVVLDDVSVSLGAIYRSGHPLE